MNPNETQPNNPQMSADQSSAALAFATQLQEQMMPQAEEQPIEGTEMPETALGQEQMPQQEETPPIDPEALKNEIKDELVKEVKNDMKAIIREELKKLLDEDEE